MIPYTVYAFAEPRGGWRYVGITAAPPEVRFSQHLSGARTGRDQTPKGAWIRMLMADGQEPLLIIVAEGLTASGATDLERRLIAERPNLLNVATGGQTGRTPGMATWARQWLTEEGLAPDDVDWLVSILGGTGDPCGFGVHLQVARDQVRSLRGLREAFA